MLVAYLDEVAEAGAFVSKAHKNYNGSPAFGSSCVFSAPVEDAYSSTGRRRRWALLRNGGGKTPIIDDSPYEWVPTAFEELMRRKPTIESKLYLSHSRGGVRDLHNSDIFARERPALAMSISQRISPEEKARMEAAKAGMLVVARASGL
jgi:hypothetical protein